MPDFSTSFVGPIIRLRARDAAIPATDALMNAFNTLALSVRQPVILAAAAKLDITSSSAADAAAGTGARTIKIYGLAADYTYQEETLTLNGNTIVQSALVYLRVFEIAVMTTGTGLVNAGDLYVVKTGTGGTYTAGVPGTLTSALIKGLAGDNYGLSGLWTAPKGTVYTLRAVALTGRGQSGTIKLWQVFADNGLAYPRYKIDYAPANPTFAEFAAPPLIVNEKDDIYFSALCATAGGFASVEAILIKQ